MVSRVVMSVARSVARPVARSLIDWVVVRSRMAAMLRRRASARAPRGSLQPAPYAAGAYFHFVALRDWSLVFEWAWPGDAGSSEITTPRAMHDQLAARGQEAHALAFDLFAGSIADHRVYFVADESAPSPESP